MQIDPKIGAKMLWAKHYLTTHILVLPSAKWDHPTRPASFARLPPACDCAGHLCSSTCPALSSGKGGPEGRMTPGCHLLPYSCACQDGTGVRLPILVPGRVRTESQPNLKEHRPPPMLAASSCSLLGDTGASPTIWFAVPPLLNSPQSGTSFPPTPCHGTPLHSGL